MSSKICFIGIKDTVDMWCAFGIDVFYSTSFAETKSCISQAVEKKYELIYVAGEIDKIVFNEIERLNNTGQTVITILPSIQPSKINWADVSLKHLSVMAGCRG